jgi:hypothetical protein
VRASFACQIINRVINTRGNIHHPITCGGGKDREARRFLRSDPPGLRPSMKNIIWSIAETSPKHLDDGFWMLRPYSTRLPPARSFLRTLLGSKEPSVTILHSAADARALDSSSFPSCIFFRTISCCSPRNVRPRNVREHFDPKYPHIANFAKISTRPPKISRTFRPPKIHTPKISRKFRPHLQGSFRLHVASSGSFA